MIAASAHDLNLHFIQPFVRKGFYGAIGVHQSYKLATASFNGCVRNRSNEYDPSAWATVATLDLNETQ